MKKFINHPENVVEEMLQGLAVLNPGVARLSGHKVMIRADVNKTRDQQVAIISGGGSGHEPAHAGYIGEGMLSAGVAGEVFTSPDTDSILAAIKAVAGKPGVLLVVKNYTGDRLNFGCCTQRINLRHRRPRSRRNDIHSQAGGGRRGAGQEPDRSCGYRQSSGEIPGHHGRFVFLRHFPYRRKTQL